MADVTVSFGADTTALDAAVSKVKAETQNLVPGGVGSGVLTPLPAGLGGPSAPPGGGFRVLTEEERAAARAANELADAQKNVSEASQRAGINFEAMAQRMLVRFVIFEALRLAIQGVKYAFDQMSNLQQAEIQFDAMADGADHLSARFQYLKQQSEAALIPAEKGAQIVQTLQDYGASADQASLYVKDLGQWSKILGVDGNTLAEALGRVSRGEDLEGQSGRLVTHMMGDQAQAGRELVRSLVDQEQALKRLQTQNALTAESVKVLTLANERADEMITRSQARGQAFLKETGILPTIQAQLPKLAKPEYAGQSIETLLATSALHLPGGGLGISPVVMNQIKDYFNQYREGLKEIQKEEGLTDQAMRANVAANAFSVDYVMSKYRDAHDDKMRAIEREGEATTSGMQRQVTTAQAGIAGTKAALAIALPQAVTAPPLTLETQFKTSLDGLKDALVTALSKGITDLMTALGKLQVPMDNIDSTLSGGSP